MWESRWCKCIQAAVTALYCARACVICSHVCWQHWSGMVDFLLAGNKSKANVAHDALRPQIDKITSENYPLNFKLKKWKRMNSLTECFIFPSLAYWCFHSTTRSPKLSSNASEVFNGRYCWRPSLIQHKCDDTNFIRIFVSIVLQSFFHFFFSYRQSTATYVF